MMQPLTISNLGLDRPFPESLYIIYQPSTDRYACYHHQGIHGLACFRTEDAAFHFSDQMGDGGMMTQRLSFDEARDTAKARPMPIVSLMLMDDRQDPEIHFVR